MADNRLIVFEIGDAEIAQHGGALKAGTLIHGHHLRAVFPLREFARIGDHHRWTSVAFRPQLREEYVLETLAVNAFNKQHRATVAGLLELALGQRSHAGVRFASDSTSS